MTRSCSSASSCGRLDARNSLTNGKQARLLQHAARRVRLPLVMALAVGLTSKSYYEDTSSGRELRRHARAELRAERWEEQTLLASTISAEIAASCAAEIADRNHDAIPLRSGAAWPTIPAQSEDVDAEHNRLAARTSSACRRPATEAAITYNVGNGGPTLDQRDVIDAGSSSSRGSGCSRRTTPTSCARWRWWTHDPQDDDSATASCATTATATATLSDGRRGLRRTRHGTSGRLAASAGSGARQRRRRRAVKRLKAMQAMAARRLIPSRRGPAGSGGLAFGTTDDRVDRFENGKPAGSRRR